MNQTVLAFCQRPEVFGLDRDVMRACTQAIAALPSQPGVPLSRAEDALARLKKRDTQGAKAIYQEVLTRKAAEGKGANQEAAEAARNLVP